MRLEMVKVGVAPPTTLANDTVKGTSVQASLVIDSTPAGADIEINRAFVGNTPSTVAATNGSHEVTVRKKGFTDWSKTLNVTGGTVHLNADLGQSPAI